MVGNALLFSPSNIRATEGVLRSYFAGGTSPNRTDCGDLHETLYHDNQENEYKGRYQYRGHPT